MAGNVHLALKQRELKKEATAAFCHKLIHFTECKFFTVTLMSKAKEALGAIPAPY